MYMFYHLAVTLVGLVELDRTTNDPWLKTRMEFFLNRAEFSLNSVNSANSGNLINHWSMNWVQFEDPISHMCLAGAVVASWSLTPEVAGLSPFTVMTNIFVTVFTEFSEIFMKNSNGFII